MPIRFDRYRVPDAPTAGPRAPVLGPDLGPAQALESLSRAGMGIAAATEKRQQLIDQSTMAERYMQAISDMDRDYAYIQATPDLHEKAPEHWASTIKSTSQGWYKGLRSDLATRLQRELIGKQLEYQSKARHLQTTHYVDKAGATVMVAQQRLKEEASRLDKTDERAFEELMPTRDASGAVAPGRFEKLLDGYVQLGFLSQTDKEKILAGTLEGTAYARAARIAAESPSRYIELMAQEEAKKGSTFLRYLDPDKRTVILTSAKDKKRTLLHEEQRQQDRARETTERMLTQATTEMGRRLEQRYQEGTLDLAYLKDAEELGLVTGPVARHYRDALRGHEVQGGFGDAATIQRFDTERYVTEDPRTLRDEVLAMPLSRYPLKERVATLAILDARIKALESAPPTMRQKNVMAKDLVREALRVSGPMAAQVNPLVQSVLTEALEELNRNEAAGFPKDPLTVYHEKKAEWQARAHVPASFRMNELRRSIGLPPRLGDKDEVIQQERQKLAREYRALQPGDPKREEMLQRARRLKELEDLEFQVQRLRPTGVQATPSTPTGPSAPKSGYAPPVSGPRR